MAIRMNLDVMMAKRKIGLTELSKEVDITMANLSILKNNKAKGRTVYDVGSTLQGAPLSAGRSDRICRRRGGKGWRRADMK